MTRYRFQKGKTLPAAQWEQPGKATWANMLDIELSRDEAIRLIADLAHQLERRAIHPETDPGVQLTWVGELTENPDD